MKKNCLLNPMKSLKVSCDISGESFACSSASVDSFACGLAELEINFFAGIASATWYKNKVAAKLTYPVANIGGFVIV